MSAELSFVLSQCTRVTDRQTDIHTDGRTALQCSAVKTRQSHSDVAVHLNMIGALHVRSSRFSICICIIHAELYIPDDCVTQKGLLDLIGRVFVNPGGQILTVSFPHSSFRIPAIHLMKVSLYLFIVCILNIATPLTLHQRAIASGCTRS